MAFVTQGILADWLLDRHSTLRGMDCADIGHEAGSVNQGKGVCSESGQENLHVHAGSGYRVWVEPAGPETASHIPMRVYVYTSHFLELTGML